jgi:uncharacterized protein with HEPN domain/predicted nucleotidyltransferase
MRGEQYHYEVLSGTAVMGERAYNPSPVSLPLALAAAMPRIREICDRYAVSHLGLIGSALRRDFSHGSDYDFVVDFAHRMHLPWAGQLLGLKRELENLLGRDVDVIEKQHLDKPELQAEIAETEYVLIGDARQSGPLTHDQKRMDEHDSTQRRISRALGGMRQACLELESFISDKTRADYATDRLFSSAIERQLIILGEATLRLRRWAPRYEQSWPQLHAIVGFRNVLVHEYDEMDPDRIWRVLTEEIAPLRQTIEQLLDQNH